MALVLHYHPLSSCCWKVLIALYEAGTPFEPRLLQFGDEDATAAFRALWPTAKIPLLEDDGRIVPETSIIIEHLDRHHPGAAPLLPRDADARLEARLWDRLFDLYAMTPMQRAVAQHLRPEAERDPRGLDEARRDLAMIYDLIETRLAGRIWAAGDEFGIADCAAAPALFYAAAVLPYPDGHDVLAAYVDRLLARPSVARTIAEAAPFMAYFPLRDALPPRFRLMTEAR